MPSTEIALDDLCAAMLASFGRANRLLAEMPLPAHAQAGGPAWTDRGAGPIPWQQFASQPRLTLAAAELRIACHVRRNALAGAVILCTQPPAWWQRLGRAYAALEVQLAVVDEVCTLRFVAATGAPTAPVARANAALRLTLSPQQQAQLAALRPAAPAGQRWLTRLLRWLRRLS